MSHGLRPRRAALAAALAVVCIATVTPTAAAQVPLRESILASLTDISCEVLTQEHPAQTVFTADAALRGIVKDVALSDIVETPSQFGRSNDHTLLSLAAEARDRFKAPPDRNLAPTAADAEAVLSLLEANRTGPDVTAERWFFAPMKTWSVIGGAAFKVQLGVCPTHALPTGSVVAVSSSNQGVLADSAFSVDGTTLNVQTAPIIDGPNSATVTIMITTATGLASSTEFPVSVLRGTAPTTVAPPTIAPDPGPTPPAPPTTATPPTTGAPASSAPPAPFVVEAAASGDTDLSRAVRMSNWSATPEAVRAAALDAIVGAVSAPAAAGN